MKVATGTKRVREEETFCCLVIHLVEVCNGLALDRKLHHLTMSHAIYRFILWSVRPRVRAFGKKKFSRKNSRMGAARDGVSRAIQSRTALDMWATFKRLLTDLVFFLFSWIANPIARIRLPMSVTSLFRSWSSCDVVLRICCLFFLRPFWCAWAR